MPSRGPNRPATPLHAETLAALACAVLAAAAPVAPGDGPAAGQRELRRAAEVLAVDLKALAAARQRLIERLDARMQADGRAGKSHDFVLRLDAGADDETLHVVLRRRGGDWASCHAVVPAWRHETMQEKFHFFTGSDSVSRDKFRYDVRPSGLTFAGGALAGDAQAEPQLDMLRRQREPITMPFSWWDRFLTIGYTKPRPQRYTIDARCVEGAYEFSCVIEGGIAWQSRRKRPGKGKGADQAPLAVARRPILITFRVPVQPWKRPHLISPTWNRAVHEADASGLSFAGGRLTGDLRVTLIPDLWVPSDRKNRTVTFTVDGTLRQGRFEGTYRARGDLGEYAGAIVGTGGTIVQGRYDAVGALGACSGEVAGYANPVPDSVADLFAAPPALSGDPASAVAAAADQATKLYRDIRALHLALTQYPCPVVDALQQVATVPPRWPEADGKAVSPPALKAIVGYVEALRAIAAAAVGGAADEADFVRGAAGLADERFGPYAAVAPLAGEAGKPSLLPADLSDSGPQRWQYVAEWRLLGPLPVNDGEEHNWARLPDVVFAEGATYAADAAEADRKGISLPARRPGAWKPVSSADGLLRPEGETGMLFQSFRGAVYFAAAEVHSDKARDVWLAVNANDFGKLWVNDRLVWADAEKQFAYRRRDKAIFKVALRAGLNRLLVRFRSDRNFGWVRLHLCTAGRPAAAEEVAKRRADDAKARAEAGLGGFRGPLGDGTSVYPDADPPLAWDIDKGVNVAWRMELPFGRAQPIVVGEKVFVNADPHTLYCLDAATGRELWRRDSSVFDLLDPSLRGVWAEWRKVRTKEDHKRFSEMFRGKLPAGLVLPDRGCGSTTAVSDGKCVWVHYGTGVAACYDLAGKRKWMVQTHLTGATLLPSQRGCILEGRPTATWPLEQPAKGKGDASHGLVALDAETGQARWRKNVPGSPHGSRTKLLRLAGAGGKLEALLAASGQIFDATDGKVLFDELQVDPHGSYVVSRDADTLYYTAMGDKTAVKLWLDAHGRLSHRMLWNNHYEVTGFFNVIATSVARDGVLYAYNQVLERGPHCPCAQVEVIAYDAATGEPLRRIKPVLLNTVTHWIPPAVAGNYLYVSDSGGGTHGGLQTHGQIAVIRRGPGCYVVCRNLVDLGTSAAPVFSGKRMYLRSPAALTCVAVTTDAGRRHQDEKLAQTLLASIGPTPKVPEIRAVPPAKDYRPPRSVPVEGLVGSGGVIKWLAAGPFPWDGKAIGEEADQAVAGIRAEVGTPLTHGGTKLAFAPLGREFTRVTGPHYAEYYNLQGRGMRFPSYRRRFDPIAFLGADKVGYFYSALDNPVPRVVTATMEGDFIAMWLAGRRIRANEVLRLAPGLYPLLLRISPVPADDKPEMPIDVAKALAGGALGDVKWPTSWHVLGPLPPNKVALNAAELTSIPKQMTLNDETYLVNELPVGDDHLIDLTCLLDIEPNERPKQTHRTKQDVSIRGDRIAYALAAVDCPADGKLLINASADWWMAWYVDGQEVFSTWDTGNRTAPAFSRAHTFAAKVTKGRHVLAVKVKAGGKGWSFNANGGFTAGPTEAIGRKFPEPKGVAPPTPDRTQNCAFRELRDPRELLDIWVERVRDRKADLEALAKTLAGTDYARQVREMLADFAKHAEP